MIRISFIMYLREREGRGKAEGGGSYEKTLTSKRPNAAKQTTKTNIFPFN